MTLDDVMNTDRNAFLTLYRFCQKEQGANNLEFLMLVRQMNPVLGAVSYTLTPKTLAQADTPEYVYRRCVMLPTARHERLRKLIESGRVQYDGANLTGLDQYNSTASQQDCIVLTQAELEDLPHLVKTWQMEDARQAGRGTKYGRAESAINLPQPIYSRLQEAHANRQLTATSFNDAYENIRGMMIADTWVRFTQTNAGRVVAAAPAPAAAQNAAAPVIAVAVPANAPVLRIVANQAAAPPVQFAAANGRRIRHCKVWPH